LTFSCCSFACFCQYVYQCFCVVGEV
jgi:hypothetical protein